MGYRCCVGICDNDSPYKEKIIKHAHVDELRFHKFPTDPDKRQAWLAQIAKGRAHFNAGQYTFVCSNHFIDGKPTTANPHPPLFLTMSDKRKTPPTKRQKVNVSLCQLSNNVTRIQIVTVMMLVSKYLFP